MQGNEATAPTFRPDLEREIDLVEEVARRIGLDRIPRTVPSSPEKIGGLSERQRDRRTVSDVLVGAGYDEVFTLPLLAPADLTSAGLSPGGEIEVENPLRAEESILRPALLPGLLRAGRVQRRARRSPTSRCSKAAPCSHRRTRAMYSPPSGVPSRSRGRIRPDVCRTSRTDPSTSTTRRPRSSRSPRSCASPICASSPRSSTASTPPGRRRSSSTARRSARSARSPPAVVDVAVARRAGGRVRGRRRRAPRGRAHRPPRAACVAVPRVVGRPRVRRRRRRAGRSGAGDARARPGATCSKHVALFDVFRSDALGSGRVSLAFALRFRAPDRTLTDEEVSELRQRCIDAVVSAHGAELRG